MYQKPLLLTLLIICINTFSSIAQEWEHLIENEHANSVRDFWITKQGDIYANIYQNDWQANSTTSSTHTHLLILNKKGQLKGKIRINNCSNKSTFYPLKNGDFLTAGRNCDPSLPEKYYKNDLRLFSKEGELLAVNDLNIKNFHAGRCRTDDGLISIRKSSLGHHGSFYLCEINGELDYQESYLHIEPWKKKGLDLNVDYTGSVWLEGSTLVAPFRYAQLKKNNQPLKKVYNSILLKLNADTVFWSYPSGNQKVKILGTKKMGKNLLVAIQNVHKKINLITLNQNGEELKKLTINTKGVFQKMMVMDDKIVIASHTSLNEGYALYVTQYDNNGNQLHQKKFYDGKYSFTQGIIRGGKNSVIIAGSYESQNNTPFVAFIRKINFSSEIEKIEDTERIPIQKVSVEEISPLTLSVSAFPNPTTIQLNVYIKEGFFPESKYLLQILTIDGKVIQRENFSNNPLTIEVAELSAGTYIYQVFRKDEEKEIVVSGKFVKL